MNTPEGWKLVPVEPTEKMLKEAKRCVTGPGGAVMRSQEQIFVTQFKAALAAAPSPEVERFYEEQPDGSIREVDPSDKGIDILKAPAPEVAPYAYAYEDMGLTEEELRYWGPVLHLKRKPKDYYPPTWRELALYTRPAPSELVKVAEDAAYALEKLHEATGATGSTEKLLAEALRAALDKVKS